MSRLFRDIALAAAVLAAIGAIGLVYLSVATVTVRNKTDQTLNAVKIGLAGKEVWQGDLAAGDSKWTFGVPKQDGGAEVTYLLGDRRYEANCGYFMPGSSFDVVILPEGHSTCEQSH